jgi:hypothetical protein
MLTIGQKKGLHSAARQAGYDDDARRMIQKNIGGFSSAADKTASREGYIAVMAFYEGHCNGQLNGCTPGYWASEDERANPTDAITHRINCEAQALDMSPQQLDQFVAGKHMTDGKFDTLAACSAYWLHRVLQALLEIRKRRRLA